MTTMNDTACSLPEYYEMVKGLAFVSSIGFGACTAASLQVATTHKMIKPPAPLYSGSRAKIDMEMGITAETFMLMTRHKIEAPAKGSGHTPGPSCSSGVTSDLEKQSCTTESPRLLRGHIPPTIRGGFLSYDLLRNRKGRLIQKVREYARNPSSVFAIAAAFYAVALILSLPLNLLLTWQTSARAVAEKGIVRSMVGADVYISVVCVVAAALVTTQALKLIKPVVGWITLSAVLLVALTFVVILARVHTNPQWNDPGPRQCVWFTGV